MAIMDSLRIAQSQNDFSVSVTDRDWKSEWINLISAQTTKMEINLVRCELTLYVRQLRAGVVQDVIFHLLTQAGGTIDSIGVRPAKSKKHGAEYVFVNGRLLDHGALFDYSSKEPLLHKLVFSFEHVNLYSPHMNQPITYYPHKYEPIAENP